MNVREKGRLKWKCERKNNMKMRERERESDFDQYSIFDISGFVFINDEMTLSYTGVCLYYRLN